MSRLARLFILSVVLAWSVVWNDAVMAAPVFQAAGTAVSGTGTVNPAWPAHAIDDVALLFIESAGGQPATLSAPAGFVAVLNSPQATGATTAGTQITVFWARATSAAMTAPTVADPGNHVYARIITYRNVINTGNPWDVTGGGVKAAASTTVTVTGVTTTVPDTLIVQAVARDNDSTAAAFSAQANANLAGIAERSDAGTTSGNGGGFAVWDGIKATAGATGNTTATVTSSINAFLTIALKPQPPSVVSINRADPDPTNAASVSWTVTFSASVTGVSSSNFTLVNSGLGGTPAITSVTGSGNTRTVTASTGTGSGTLGLNMTNTTGVSPALTNLPFTGQVYTMDGTAPVVSSLARVNPTPTALASVSWTVTFSESVTGVNAADFALVQAGGVSGALITSVTGSGVSWTVTASTGTGNGTLGLNLTDDDSIIDSVSNPLGGTGAGNGSFTGEVYTVTRPVAYYHDTTAGVAIGFDGSTNVTGGDQIITATTPITALLNPVSTCPVTSARSVNHPAGLYTHSRWYLNTNYAVATNIGANPSGSADLRGRGVGVETVIVSLYDYDPVSGAKTQIGSSPAITITGATTAYPYSISSPLYTVPAGHRLMLQYDFNQPTTTDRARVYCSTPSPSYIAVTETAAPLVVSASASTVVANPTSVAADNVTTSTITVTLKTSSGLPVPGKTVTLAAGSGSSVITTVSGTTDAGGVATFTVKDGTVEGPITYTATDTTDSIVITQTAQVTFTAPSLCFADSFAGTLGASWSVGSQSGSWTPAIVSGRLRLTDATTGQSTWATLQRLLPAAGNKVTVEFDYFAYGGSGADGVAVVFSDASEAPAAGAFGGSLGYAQKSNPGSDCVIVGGCPGFAGGWLGIALDEYGNFSNPTEGRYGGTGQVIDSVSIRGSGTGVSGYRFLQGTATLSPGIDGNNVPPGTVAHRYRIIIDHTDSVHAYVSVERDTTSGAGTAYTNLIAPFDVKDPGYSQSAIPVSFNLSFTGSTGASTNIHEIGNLSTCTAQPLVVPTLHHIEIDHGGSACTSGTAPVTVKACADAGCTALYLGNVTVDLTPNAGGALTWAPTEPVTFSGGSVELTLANTTANTQTLGGTATSPTAVNATRCFNGATETCALVFSVCTFDALEVSLPTTNRVIYTKLANTAFDLSVLSLSGANQTVNTVELVNASSGTCSTFPSLGSTSTTVPSPFTGNQRKTFSFTYAEAAPNVRVRLTNSASVKSCSSDNFAIRPQAFAVTSSASNSGTGGTPIFRAGTDPFSLTATAGYSGYTGIPLLNASLISTSLANLGSVEAVDFPAASAGASTANGFKYDEVGNFNLAQYAVYDDAFATVDSVKGECTPGFSNVPDGNGKYSCQFGSAVAGPFGRFVPDHFTVVGAVSDACAAGAFTYMGQSFALSQAGVVEARNFADDVTANYAETYAPGSVTFGAEEADNGIDLGGSLVFSAGHPFEGSPLAGAWTAGVFTLTGGATAVTFTRPAAPSGSFEQLSIGLTVTDTDVATVPRVAGADFNPGAIGGAASYKSFAGSPLKMRFGRLKLSNAHGSELLNLPVPIQAQYWNGTAFVPNEADNCTALASTNFALGNYQRKAGDTWTTSPTLVNTAAIQGRWQVNLSKPSPTPAGKGSVDLCVDLGTDPVGGTVCSATASANLPYLQGLWSPGTSYNNDPKVRATFGVFKGNDEFIYLREMY